jgi:KDO2-lipid IV(A) lauroyltransferase
MQLLAYLILYPMIWFTSILPFRVLYFFSDIWYIIIYHIIGYRKKTVRENLALTLRHLSPEERKVVEKKFYHHFTDSFFEMAKTLTISDKELDKRLIFENYEVIDELEAKGKSFILLMGHYASYEWLVFMNRRLKTHKGFGIYKVIKNKYFDRLARKIRGKYNAHLIGTRETIPTMRQNERDGILGLYGFITDQSPKLGSAIHWGNFFGMEVPVFTGGEMLAKKLGMNMVYARVNKVSRGHYSAKFIPIEGDLQDIPNYQVTENYLRILEQQILEAPEYYLWTHKRFKHRKNDPA